MTVESELLAAILAAPDDDQPRLVYADHLMQQGDPRGEFIALQCKLAAADAADEPTDEAVVAREQELREAHAATWTIGLTAIVPAGYTFHRGFVEHVLAWGEADIAWRQPHAILAELLREAPPEPHDRLGDLIAAAPLVRSLATRGPVIDHVITDAWKALRTVDLQSPHASAETVAAFLGHPALASLRRLQLSCVDADPDAARAWLGLSQPLEHLGFVVGWHVAGTPSGDLAALIADNPALRELRSLHLGNIAITNLPALAALTKLERLAVHRTAITADALIALIAKLPALEVLELDDADQRLGTIDLPALLAAAPKLRRLALRDCEPDVVALAKSPHAASLRRIDLEHCHVETPAAQAMLDSPHLRGVRWWRFAQEQQLSSGITRGFAARHTLRYEPPRPDYPRAVVEPLPGNKILAIKAYRAHTHSGLADAKMSVERIMEELGMGPSYQQMRATTRWVRA